MVKICLFSLAVLALAGCGGNPSTSVSSKVVVVEYPSSPRVNLGDPAEFTLVAKGINLTYQWWHKGERISGATLPTYRIASVTVADFGDYTVDITQGDQTRGVFTELVEVGAPTLIEETTSDPAGGKVTFTLLAKGDPAPTYAWYDAGTSDGLPVLIPGETGPSLTVPLPYSPADPKRISMHRYDGYATNRKGSLWCLFLASSL